VPNLVIAKLDCDLNDADPRYITESTIPNLKFFANPKGRIIPYNGARNASSILEFIHQELQDTTSAFNLEKSKAKLLQLEDEENKEVEEKKEGIESTVR